MITIDQIKSTLEDMGLTGKSVVLHSSLKSFGDEVEGGAKGIIDAFLALDCTLVVPTFSNVDNTAYPPEEMRPRQNAIDYSAIKKEDFNPIPYHTADNYSDGFGIIPATLLEYPERIRGSHPLNSFAALGPKAQEIMETQTAEAVYAPMAAVMAQDGVVLLVGVDLCRATILHYAEELAGRRLFVRWAQHESGKVFPATVGSCSSGFMNLEKAIQPAEGRVTVGTSLWRYYPAKEMVLLATNAIKENPNITRCPNPGCQRCRDIIAGGPIWE